MADNPYMALARKSEAQDEAAENPYLALVKPDPLAPRAAVPNAPLGDAMPVTELAPVVVRPSAAQTERSWGDALGDTATRIRQGLNNVVGGVLGAPVNIYNAAEQFGSPMAAADTIGRRALGLPDPVVVQPEAVQGMRAVLTENNAREDEGLSLKARRQQAEFQQADGLAESLGYLARNPSFAGTEAAAQLPQFLQLIPGSVLGTVGAQAVGAGSQNAQQVEQDLIAQGMAPEEAATRAADVFAASATINAGLPGVIPGGASIERLIAGQIGRGVVREGTSTAARFAVPALGEMVTEGAQEGADQIIQNIATDRPLMEQVGQGVALGMTVGGPGGLAAGAADVLTNRTISPPQTFPNQAPREPEAPQTPAIDPAILAGGNAALGEAAPVAPAVAPAPLGQPEDTSDIDAMLAANIPPEVAAQAQEVAANATPEQQQAAMQVLGELLDPSPAAPSEPASSPAQPESPADGAAATSFMQQAAASMRMRSQEQAARTADPAAQSPAAPVGSRPAGGDLAPAKQNAATTGDALTMQNRDRSRAAAVAQMQDIRKAPDPDRLGFSRDPNTGAPMVGEGQPVPDADKGRQDTVVMASGRRVPVRYAVVEAEDVAASHDADGRANPGYDAAPLKALNNGRTAGLQAAYAGGNADAYRQGIAADEGLHGVSAAAIASKRNPVLVRLYDPAANTGDMGAESNASAQLGLSPVEQAQTDARGLPDLSGLRWAEDGSISPAGNANFFRAWFANMGEAQAASLQDAQGRPNAAALQRVRAAMVHRAYGDERLLTAMAEEVNPDNRNVMNALVQAAPAFATLERGGLTDDMREALVGGLETLRDASARGLSLVDALGQGDLLGRNANADTLARFMAENARSAKRMAEAFKAMAEYAADAESQAATLDVFGNAPAANIGEAFNRAGIDNDTGSTASRVAEGRGGREPAQDERAPAGDAFTLANPEPAPARQEVAPSQGAGLFGAPTTRDFIDSAQRGRDAARNGRAGTGRTDMLAGDGELFAGRRPEQARVPEAEADEALESVEPSQTDTPAFRRWFGDSKVVDANGAPLVVYHGTGRSFDAFDTAKRGSVTRASSARRLFFFTDSPEVASDYADYAASVPVRDLVEKSERLERQNKWDEAAAVMAQAEALDANAARGQAVMPVYLAIQNPLRFDAEGQSWQDVQYEVNTVIAQAERRGHDGIIIENLVDDPGEIRQPSTHYGAFRPEQIKSATANRGTFDPDSPNILENAEAPFYSAALRTIEEAKGAPKRADAAAWKGWLDGAVRRGDMKQSERDWLGIDDFLAKNGVTTREQLADFVRANEVQVGEVTLGGEGADRKRAIERAFPDYYARTGVAGLVNGRETPEFLASPEGQARAAALAADPQRTGEPKFASYTLPGGENYRELLLTLPISGGDPLASKTREELGRLYEAEIGYNPIEDDPSIATEQLLDLVRSLGPAAIGAGTSVSTTISGGAFQSNHFDQPNILAHVRFNERTDADGKRVLFIEEIQSDWHQAGRKRGYRGEANEVKVWTIRNAEGDGIGSGRGRTAQEAIDDWRRIAGPRGAEAIDATSTGESWEVGDAVPDAPFKGTDEWAILAFKRMVRHAAENGFDRIAWTTGEQQAERYDLSKQVDSIAWKPHSKTGQKRVVLNLPSSRAIVSYVDDSGIVRDSGVGDAHAGGQFTGKRLDEVVGKEVADKIMAADAGTLKGDGLKLGGEGMRAFYDKILPSAVNKWAKRFGGRVGDVYLDPNNKATVSVQNTGAGSLAALGGAPVHSIDITPAMRDAALQGQPLFNEEPGQSAPSETPPAGSDLPEISRRMGEADAERLGLRAAVNEALGKVGEKVIFLRDYAGLPEKQRRGIEARMQQREGRGRTSALYDPATKNVYVFTQVVRTPDRAVWNAAHEIAGHEGLRTLLGDKLDHALGIALQNPTVAAVADAIASERVLRPDQRMLAAEEALAELAAAVRTGNFAEIEGRYAVPVPEGIRERLTRAIENFLRRLKAMVDDIFGRHQFTDEDVRALLENAWQAVNRPANGELAPDLDGVDATAPDQTQTPEFRRWFGDSKVVDENGAPLVVYHGTTRDFTTFDSSRAGQRDTGWYGAGIYLTADHELASAYSMSPADENGKVFTGGFAPGANLIPAYVSLQNPYYWPSDREVGKTPEDSRAIRDELQAAGHDGVIVSNPYMEDGVRRDFYEVVAFRPEQIKSATGNRGTFDPSNPSILESVDDARGRAEARRNEAADTLPVARGAAGWNYDAGKWEGRKGQANNARAALQDKMLAWRDVQGQIEANLQAAIPDAQNVYRLENLMHGRVGEGIDRIEREQVKPLVDAMRAAKVEPATLEEYLYARHAQERNAQIAEINPAMPDGGSGMTNAEAAKILASAEKATLEPLAKRVDAIAKATRRRLLANGLITQEAFDAMEAQYEHYVPLRGKQVDEAEDFGRGGTAGRGLDSRGKPVRNALGRGAGNRAQNILGEVIGDAERSVILAEKARVGRGVMRIVLANPNPSLWQVEPVQTERALDASGEVYEKVVNDWSDPSVVAVRHKGQLYRVQINSVPLAKALNNVGVDQLGGVTRMAGVVNRYFSAILTKYNPAFTPVNASRDALFGLTGLAAEHGEAAALDAALHYPQAARAAFRHARGAEGDSQWDRWAAEFAAAGGKTGYVNMPSAEEIARKIGSGSLTSYSPTGLRRAASVVGEAVGVLNDAVENALRLSAYVTLRKRGQSAEAAAAYAKDLTVNFNRKGFDGSKLNAWFLFYNASIQGAHRVSKLARKPKTWSYLGALATAQVIATLAAMGMEDDNGEPLWNKVPDHVKRRNIVIVTPDGGLITIPMPYGFNLFPYIAGRITESVVNRERGEKRASDGAAQLTADFIGSGLESFSPVPLDDGVAGLLPTLLRIPVNVWANRNDFGRPIRMEQPYAKSDVPRASMGRPDTLQVFKLMSQGLNRLGGGDDLTPPPLSAFDVAPEDLEYLVKTFTGGPGNLVVDIATIGQKITGGDYAQDADPRDIPITKRFVSNIDEQAAQAAMFYDRRETIDRSLKRVRLAFKSEGAEAAEKLLAATPELTGAVFKRRKKEGRHGEPPGSIILVGGNPQIVVGESRNRGTRGPVRNPGELSVYAAYKAAEEAIGTRNENVETAYAGSPAGLTPNRQRDAFIRTENNIRQAAQSEFNAAWVRDVVGAAE